MPGNGGVGESSCEMVQATEGLLPRRIRVSKVPVLMGEDARLYETTDVPPAANESLAWLLGG
jgi:hypothetical protein